MFNQPNISIFALINKFAGSSPLLDAFAILLAKYLPFVFIVALLYLWLKKREDKDIALYAGYSALFGLLLNFVIGLFYFHPRPFMEHLGTVLINHSPGTSFPSDHATFMLAIAFELLWFKRTRALGLVLFPLGIIGGIARVFCGLHFPFDIIGSLLVAAISSGLIFLLRKRLGKINNFILKIWRRVRLVITK